MVLLRWAAFATDEEVGVRCGDGDTGGDGEGESPPRNRFIIRGDGEALGSEWG